MVKRAARIDENQPGIVSALRQAGASVQPLHAVGQGCPDLLVGYGRENYLMEVKNPEKPKRDQRLTDDQTDWHAEWQGEVFIVRTQLEALKVIGLVG